MRNTLAPGLSVRRTLTIDDGRAIAFLGDAVRVYATPSMVNDLEFACRDLMLQHLEAGEDSVGMRIELDHLGPTPLGHEVAIEATVAAVDGRGVTFDVEVRDAIETVGRGRHVRFVIDTARAAARVADKARRLAASTCPP